MSTVVASGPHRQSLAVGLFMIKRFIIAIILLVLVCGGIVGFNIFRDQAIQQYFATMPVPAVAVSTVKVEPATWRPGIETIGTVSASRGVDLTVETTGIVKEVRFTANQEIAAGAVLVQLDDAVQRADLAAAKTQGGLDQQALDRAVALQKRGVGTEATLDQARAAASNSASQIDKLQAVLDQKQLRAPFSGTAGIPRVEAGQYIQPGTVVATLQDLKTVRADFSVPEQQLGLLKIGGPVRFGLTADKLDFNGAITGIEPKVDPVSRLVSVRAEVRDANGRLSPGQFVQVRVDLPQEDNVIAVPQTALVSSLYGDFVYAVRPPDAPAEGAAPAQPAPPAADAAGDAKAAPAAPAPPALVAKQIFVKGGRRSEGRIEITNGLKAGDEVVTAGQNRLSNNAPVTIDNAVQPNQPPPAEPDAPEPDAAKTSDNAPGAEANAQ